jgi:hypothetical protein
MILNISKVFSSFSVNDIQKAKKFYGTTLGLELANGPEGTLVVLLCVAKRARPTSVRSPINWQFSRPHRGPRPTASSHDQARHGKTSGRREGHGENAQ